MRLETIKAAIMDSAELGALAAVRELYPTLDEVRLSEAAKLCASERWLKLQIRRGNLTVRQGPSPNSPKTVSRFEIAALKKAETLVITLK